MKLKLRAFAKEDIAPLISWFASEKDVLQWAGASLPYPIQERDLKALIGRHKRGGPDVEVWAVETELHEMVGHVQLSYNIRMRQVTLGRVALDPAERGQGYAKQLMRLAIDRSFSWSWVNRLELMVYDFNTIASSVYSGVGFTHEGTRRQSTPVADTFWNTDVMSLLRMEYQAFDKRTERE